MHPLTVVMLGVCSATTLFLIWYVAFYLPAQMRTQVRESLRAFSTAIELRCPLHKGLTQRVVVLSLAAGKTLGLSEKQLDDLEMAACVRDIGLCSTPFDILNRPSPMSWNDEESWTYNLHGEISSSMIETTPLLKRLSPLIKSHSQDPIGADSPIEAIILNVVTRFAWTDRWQGSIMAREVLKEQIDDSVVGRVAEAVFGVLPSVRGINSSNRPAY